MPRPSTSRSQDGRSGDIARCPAHRHHRISPDTSTAQTNKLTKKMGRMQIMTYPTSQLVCGVIYCQIVGEAMQMGGDAHRDVSVGCETRHAVQQQTEPGHQRRLCDGFQDYAVVSARGVHSAVGLGTSGDVSVDQMPRR